MSMLSVTKIYKVAVTISNECLAMLLLERLERYFYLDICDPCVGIFAFLTN